MPKASEIATELRRIADLFDKEPEIELVQPSLTFYHGYGDTKENFLSLASLFPRPFKKGDGYSHDRLKLTHETRGLEVNASIDRVKVCVLKRAAMPAEYECVPILSSIEEASLESQAAPTA